MMPELYLADALGAVGKPLLRVHTAGSVGGATGDRRGQPGPGRRAPPGAGGRVREAVGVQRDVGAVDHAAVRMPVLAGAGGYFAPHIRSYIRRAGAPGAHRRDGRGQGPAQRRLQPVRAPAAGRHDHGVGAGLADAVGPGPLRRDLPVLGRRVRGGHRRRGRGRGLSDGPVAWIRATVDAHRADHVLRQGPREPAGRAPTRRGAVAAGRASPARSSEIDVAEIYVPFSWFEPMWLENLGFAEPGQGWRLTEAGETEIGGSLPVNPSGGVLSLQPDRRVRAAPVRRGGACR